MRVEYKTCFTILQNKILRKNDNFGFNFLNYIKWLFQFFQLHSGKPKKGNWSVPNERPCTLPNVMGVNTNYCTRKALGKQRSLPGRFRAGKKTERDNSFL